MSIQTPLNLAEVVLKPSRIWYNSSNDSLTEGTVLALERTEVLCASAFVEGFQVI